MSKKRSAPLQATVLAIAFAAPVAAHAGDAMRIVRDPLTGELRGPTAAEAAAFAKAEAQLRANARASNGARAPINKGPTEIRYPDGTVETKLDEDSMMFSVVSVDAEGRLNFDCLPAEQARKFVQTRTTSSSSKGKTRHAH